MTDLIVVNPQEFGLEKTEAEQIEKVFTPMLEKMKEMEKEYNEVIKLPMSPENAQKARELRLRYVKVRTGTEEIHKKAKEYYLAGSRFCDAWRNAQKFAALGKESELEKIEKHDELIQQAKIDKQNAERELELSKYANASLYNYKDMPDEVFASLLATVKAAWDKEQEAIKQAEEERLKKQEEDKLEQERVRQENEKLKQEAEAREKELAKERAEQEKKLEAERAKAKQEAEAREKAEAELQAKKEEEARLKRESEAKEQTDKLAQLEAEKQARLAPDRDKLLAYAKALEAIDVPELQSQEAKDTLADALELLSKVFIQLRTK